MARNHKINILLISSMLVISNCTNIDNNKANIELKNYSLHETIGTDEIAQEDVPAMVKKNIYLEFSDAEQIEWQSLKDYFIDFDDTVVHIYQDEEPSVYIANFLKDGHYYRVQYKLNGELIEYEEWIEFDELPILVINSFEKNYDVKSIDGSIRKFTLNHKVTYRIKILLNDLPFILIYDSDGILLHKKQKIEIEKK
ncbi:MAG: hypothetical protein GXO79_16550 [Chlorobi bacterium]|nr:hypothetical protein [Chlorobiota bacterium]